MHVLTNLLTQYVIDFKQFKSNHVDKDNISFNNSHGLLIQPPVQWPLDEAIIQAVNQGDFQNIAVIYPSTKIYNEISNVLHNTKKEIEYFSWHEMYSAMNRISEDVRYLKTLKNILSKSDLVLFIGPNGVPSDVVNQITVSCSGCFIRIIKQ